MARSRHWWIAALVGLVAVGCGTNTAESSPTVGPSETAPIGAPSPESATTVPEVLEVATTVLPTTAVTAAPTTSTTVPAPCNVMFVSDSVGIDLVSNGLKDRLAYAGCTLKWTGGQRGIGVEDGARLLASASDVGADIVVVMLGYHDANSNGRAGRYPAFIDLVMQAAGTRLVVWPMYGATDDCSKNYKSGIAMANQSLQDATARWPNLRLVDYPSHLAAHPEFSQNRCPHLLANGSKEVAGWLAGQIRETANAYAAAG
jgi:hypothetical protein